MKPKDSINRSISKQLLIVGLTISLVVVSPAFARKKSVTSEIEGAVADLVHSHESVTLTEDSITANYSREEIQEIVTFAGTVGLLATSEISLLAGREDIATALLEEMEEVSAK